MCAPRFPYKTAPTLVSEASTSTTNCLVESGWMSNGAPVNKAFRVLKACSASSSQENASLVEVRQLSSATTRLKSLMKRR